MQETGEKEGRGKLVRPPPFSSPHLPPLLFDVSSLNFQSLPPRAKGGERQGSNYSHFPSSTSSSYMTGHVEGGIFFLTYPPDPEEEAAVAVVVLRRLVLLGPLQRGQLLPHRAAVGQGVAREVLKG